MPEPVIQRGSALLLLFPPDSYCFDACRPILFQRGLVVSVSHAKAFPYLSLVMDPKRHRFLALASITNHKHHSGPVPAERTIGLVPRYFRSTQATTASIHSGTFDKISGLTASRYFSTSIGSRSRPSSIERVSGKNILLFVS